jgi:hypothetical protein
VPRLIVEAGEWQFAYRGVIFRINAAAGMAFLSIYCVATPAIACAQRSGGFVGDHAARGIWLPLSEALRGASVSGLSQIGD